MFLGIVLGKFRRHPFHIRIRLGHRDTWLQPGIGEERKGIAVAISALRMEGYPDIAPEFPSVLVRHRKPKPRSRDPGHRVPAAIQRETLPYDIGVAAEPA